jgi:hypothetical protein
MHPKARKVMLTGELCTVGITDITPSYSAEKFIAISVSLVIKSPPPQEKKRITFLYRSKLRFYNFKINVFKTPQIA